MPAPDLGRLLARHWLSVALVALGLTLRIRSTDGLRGAPLACLLATGAAYVVCVRWGCWRWLAALAALPAAVDSRMLADHGLRTWFGLLLVSAAMVAFAWTGMRKPATALAVLSPLWLAGLVLGAGTSVGAADPGVMALELPGPVLAVSALLGLVAALGVGRADPWALRLAAAVTVLSGASSGLAEVAWWPVAGAVGLTATLRGRRGRASTVSQADDVDEAGLAGLHQKDGPF